MYVILMVIMLVGLIILLEKLADIDSSNSKNTKYNEQGQKCCPYCGSTHFQYAGQQIYGARPEKTKTSTTDI